MAIQGYDLCALDCSDGKTCPGGMVCLPDEDSNGPIAVCF